ncbi:MAG: hypothetical protein ABI442_19070, partial [Gemmatimonadaceae bacterium]
LAHQNFGEWFDRLSYREGPAFVSDTLVQSAGYERIALYTRNFLDAYLKDSRAGKSFLARSPEENGIPAGEATARYKTAAHPVPTAPSPPSAPAKPAG